MQNNLYSIHSWSVDTKWQQNTPLLVALSFSSCLLPPLSLSPRTYANRYKAAIPPRALALGSAFCFSALFSPVPVDGPLAATCWALQLRRALALSLHSYIQMLETAKQIEQIELPPKVLVLT